MTEVIGAGYPNGIAFESDFGWAQSSALGTLQVNIDTHRLDLMVVPRISLAGGGRQVEDRCVCAKAFLLSEKRGKNFVNRVAFHEHLFNDVRIINRIVRNEHTLRQSFIKSVEVWCGNSVVESKPKILSKIPLFKIWNAGMVK
jgi:hypothetical protein